ncbi:MAG: sugar ABC transporter ATP-binding protein [Lachnospiraceae bacterium]|nr:sugar ABC transporter ATP-binding protein [Lachnospiraceae bacterium]
MNNIRLEIKNVSKNFGITKALQSVSFNINRGEIHALIGENGSGKSTLTNSLAGIYQKDNGTFILDGKEINPVNQVEANNEGISIIVQELGTLDGLTVAENIFLGHEDRFVKIGIKNTSAMNRRAGELLAEYGFDRIKPSDMIENYNFEDRKLVEIVKATYFDPKIVVIDETTTALSREGREELYKQMNNIRDKGNTVIFISHDLPEVLKMSDTITILRDGVYIDTIKSADIDEDGLKKLMVGRDVTGKYYRSDYDEEISNEIVLKVQDVSVPGLISHISFDLHKGEILGFGGLSESGMHEIGKVCFGASYDREGSVSLADGTNINDIPTAISHSIAYTSKDRDNESLVMNQSIRDNICLPSLDELSNKACLLNDKKLKEFADKYAKQMSTKMQSVNQFVSNLSGGNKQKVVLARWIGKDSDILVLDSPTRGIDIKVKQDIYQLMDKMRKSGKSIIMISEELMELIGMCDRIIIMKDGKINGELKRSKAMDENSLISKMV